MYAGSTGTAALHTPQGSGATSPNGDFITSADTTGDDALNTYYSYFIEVPPNQTSLQVQIFDADVGFGPANEDDLGRDRNRGNYETTATYSILNPSGVSQTVRFTTGDETQPANSDNAWLTLYGVGNSVQDDFTTAAFSNNDGTADWAANWIETDSGGTGVGTGNVQVTGGQAQMQVVGNSLARQVDLLGSDGLDLTAATLTYTYSTANTEAGDTVVVEMSSNGGGAYTTVATHTGAVSGSGSINVAAYIANNTRVRFRVTNGYTVANELFFVTTVKISDGAAAPAAGHWEVRVLMNGGAGGDDKDDINAIGIRASDGDWTSGGIEYNVYADSYLSLGINPDGSGGATRTYDLYPWVTAGCTSSQNDFDRDTDSGAIGSITYTSRSGSFSQTVTDGQLSIDDSWNRDDLINYTSNQISSDYGIWHAESTINTYENSTGNYETYYVGNYLAAANPRTPGQQPYTVGGFPATYRIYMATDADGPPVKPYIEQFLTAFNGPQPSPAIGVAQTYTVTINVRNPTPWSITFSNTNTVVSNVPGSGTVYAGSPTMTAGTSIVSAPSIGGTGNVTWNAGTVAGGGSATLSYNITVTPAAATTLATGDPTLGAGTRATYVDETGAAQARATYRLGGICQLRVVVGALTEAMLAEFLVDDRGHVSWITASEAGTLGYNLYREDGSKVNENLILAGRKKYEVDDRYVAERYFLEEVMADGRVNRQGPLVTGRRLGPDVDTTPQRLPRLRVSVEAIPSIATEANDKADAVMVNVRETGIVRVPFMELVNRFGKPIQNISNSAEKGNISVKTGGQTVAWTSTADALLFFGEKNDSLYSYDRVYRVELAKGERMANVAVGGSSGSVSTFNGRAEAETDAFAAAVLPLDPESDYWFWDYVVSGDPSDGRKTFTVTAPDVASASGASIQVRLQGALAGGAHTARVKLNGVPVGELNWSGVDSKSSTLALPGGVLHDGANDVEIEGVLAPSAAFDVFYIDGFTLNYSRYARPVNGALEAKISSAINAGPFTATPMLLDVSNRLRPRVLTGGSLNAGTLSATLPSGTNTVFAAQQFVDPASYRSYSGPAIKLQRPDYIVVAPASMRSGAEALASLRQSQGLRSSVVDLQQIYDEYGNGNTTPHAIRSFIASALQQTQRPKYVVLAGTGTLDYRGIQQAPGPVPPMMVKTASGLFASDSKLADTNNDGVPELAVGRIPVSNNADLLAYVDKLRDHTASANDNPIVFAADAVDAGTDFGQASDEAAMPVADRPQERLHIDELGPQATRDGLIGAWTDGTPLVNWVGHGGFDQLASSGILTAGDAPALTTSGRLPVLVAMTCTINRFEVGGIAEPLGPILTRQDDAGALAVWSATGLSNHENAREMQRTFIKLAAAKPKLRLGDVIVQTLAAHPSDTAGIYVLLGDPAIALELPKEITNGTPHPTGE